MRLHYLKEALQHVPRVIQHLQEAHEFAERCPTLGPSHGQVGELIAGYRVLQAELEVRIESLEARLESAEEITDGE
jgi:hypothetical protein